MNEKWYVAAKKADFQGIAKRFGIDPVTARIIRNRDVVGDDEIRQYLYGTRAELGDPAQLQGGLEAASLLKQKIEAGKKIRIIGDYDIDGVNSTYILYRALTRCGAQVDYEIPDRMKDGYGLNISLLKLALEEGIDTVLTCDNGISAIAEIAYAKENGMTVIVTDHHEPLFEEVPEEGQAETIQKAMRGGCRVVGCLPFVSPLWDGRGGGAVPSVCGLCDGRGCHGAGRREPNSRKGRVKAAANHTELRMACTDSGKQSGF